MREAKAEWRAGDGQPFAQTSAEIEAEEAASTQGASPLRW